MHANTSKYGLRQRRAGSLQLSDIATRNVMSGWTFYLQSALWRVLEHAARDAGSCFCTGCRDLVSWDALKRLNKNSKPGQVRTNGIKEPARTPTQSINPNTASLLSSLCFSSHLQSIKRRRRSGSVPTLLIPMLLL